METIPSCDSAKPAPFTYLGLQGPQLAAVPLSRSQQGSTTLILYYFTDTAVVEPSGPGSRFHALSRPLSPISSPRAPSFPPCLSPAAHEALAPQ